MKIIFCIPGNNFSNRFLKCWTELTIELHRRGFEYELLSQYVPNVYKVRTLLLGGHRKHGQYQSPWQGKKEYDYIMWIDSDIIFKPEDFFGLFKHKKDIVSGLYLRQPQGGTLNDIPYEYACLKEFDRGLMTTDVNGELIEVFGTKVKLKPGKKGGAIEISYFSDDDLERILDLINSISR